ncbi:MAG: hypothetical protein QOD53_2457 [Thermoleophilaceae bacterium]|jgi:nucleoside-diphosphate-sugar epimerase|nr:hypothetical protein [Thermoleophilaceae bacterium]
MSSNGSPQPGRRVLVTGGGGYLGSVLVPRLLDRGHRVRVLDRLHWGRGPLAAVADRIELVEADVRDADATARALDGADCAIALAGVTNDATAERDPEANWQTNAVAMGTLAGGCVRAGVERLVLASSCSLYDGLAAGLHDEDALPRPRGAYSTSKHHAEQTLLSMAGEGLCPTVLRNGTLYGWSPRMRYDLVVNTFVKDALLEGRLLLHGGGRVRRPVVDVRDAAEAAVVALEAPGELVSGQVFNVLHANHRIRELAAIVATALEARGRHVELADAPAPGLTRDYECSGAKLEERLGFTPARTVAAAVDDLLARIDFEDRAALDDPRNYNARWPATAS